MRIVLVNWAKVWDGAAAGGGVNGYAQAVALELVGRGHEVAWLCGGVSYTARAGSAEPGACTVRRHADWLGVRVFEVVNSPVLAPSVRQFNDPEGETGSPELEARVGEFFGLVRPDVVHFHNIEGFSTGCIAAARGAAAKVVFSLHNYHTICPQVYLMRGNRLPCFDFENGHRCVGCIPTPEPGAEKRRLAGAVGGRAGGGRPSLLARLRSGRSAGVPGYPVEEASAAAGALESEMPDRRGRTAHILAERAGGAENPEHRPLLNIVAPEPASSRPPNGYGRRRGAMIAMLNGCDRVLAVSEFVRAKFESMGVRPGVIRTMPIGTGMTEMVARAPGAVFDPARIDPSNPRPLRFCFMGYNNYAKGLGMLADSLELVVPELLGRVHLSIFACGGQTIAGRFRRLESRLASVALRHGYDYGDIPWMLGGMDLGIVPSVWWDNGPQTVMEFLACRVPVLGAELGGIPDMIGEGRNGLLFRGNDRADLARRLSEVIRSPEVLNTLRANIRPPKGIREHAAELESEYRLVVS